MTSIIGGAVLAISNSQVGSIVAKATIVAAAGLIGARLARRSRAAVRHALLAATFGVLLMLPLASIVAPPIRIAMQIAKRDGNAKPLIAGDRNAGAVLALDEATGAVLATHKGSRFTLDGALLTAWIAGAAFFVFPMALGLRQVRSLRRTGFPWPHGQSIAWRLASDSGVLRRLEVLLHETLPGPMTCGVVAPAIMLPQNAQAWDADDLDRAIMHELEHVRRGDWLIRCLARLVCALYWFHPLVWMAWRQLELEAERACDDAVLRRSDATSYADQLVGLARQLSMVKTPFLGMANRTDLATRVEALLDGRQRRGRAGKLLVSLACTAGAALILTMSPLRIVAAPQSGADVRDPDLPLFVGNSTLVIADVIVADRNGKVIEGLGPRDFAITEDGKRQSVAMLEFQDLGASPGLPNGVSSYYVLGYYTSNAKSDGNYRKVTIALSKDASARLNYRAGYYAAQPDAPDAGVRTDGADGITAPTVIVKREPEYTEAARKAKYSGTVLLNVTVDTTGQVSDIRVARPLGMGLDEKAIEAVQQWRFSPARKNGKPVVAQAQVEVNFRIL